MGIYFGDTAPSAVTIAGNGDWQAERDRGRLQGALRIVASRGELEVISAAGPSPPQPIGRRIIFSPERGRTPLTLDRTAYRGSLEIELQPSGRLRVVNTLDLESYLRAVVPNEIITRSDAFAAVLAQAVVSRALALFIRDLQPRHPGDGFDVCTTGHCQVYRGASSETSQTNEAVRRTRGQVLTFRGRPILAAYHANAGGYTAPTDEVWPGSRRVEYLCPVSSPYDSVAADLGYADCYQWQTRATAEQIRQRVRAVTGRDVGELRDLQVARWPSGRVKELRISGGRRRVSISPPHQVRQVLGLGQADTGKSYDHDTRLVTIQSTDQGFLITGYGAGEGVGLSQHGAVGMARAGFSYEQILGHYYRGVRLTGDYGSGVPRSLPSADRRADLAGLGEGLSACRPAG